MNGIFTDFFLHPKDAARLAATWHKTISQPGNVSDEAFVRSHWFNLQGKFQSELGSKFKVQSSKAEGAV